jgi:hypothetical protein
MSIKLTFEFADRAALMAFLLSSGSPGTPQGGASLTVSDDTEGDDNAPANPNAPTLDSAGTPWDERIHSGSKALTAKGIWQRRRNTPDATFNSVMAELSARSSAPAPQQAPAAPPAMQAAVSAATMPAAPPPPSPAMIAPGAAPLAPTPPPPAAPQPDGMPFHEFMPKMSAAMQAGKFDKATLDAWISQFSGGTMTEIGQFATNPAATKAFHDWLAPTGVFGA